MGNVKALTFKSLATGAPLFLILGLFGGEGWWRAFIAAVIVSGIAYIIGDLLVLPAAGNIVATVADAGLVFALLYAFRLVGISFTLSSLLWAAVLTLLTEGLIVHPFIARLLNQDSMGPTTGERG